MKKIEEASMMKKTDYITTEDFSKEELTILAAFFTALGDNFALLST